MSQIPFLSLPVLQDDQVQSILLAYTVQFDRWPQALLPPCVTERIVAEAKDNLERRHERGAVDKVDEQTYMDQMTFCRTEKPILRTAWGYLMGERAPRWHDGSLALMNMIAISCFACMPPAVEHGMQRALMNSLSEIVRETPGVMVIPGSEGELCRLACACVWEDEADTELSPCAQMINIAHDLFEQQRLHNLIHHAAAEVSNAGQSLSVAERYAPSSLHFH